jgi:hypothetical protein
VRAVSVQVRREALTSRPPLVAALDRGTRSGDQTALYLTPIHCQVPV